MRWKTIDRMPKNGDQKVSWDFALLPVKLDDGYTVWFEKYAVRQQYSIHGIDYETAHWRTIKSWTFNTVEPEE